MAQNSAAFQRVPDDSRDDELGPEDLILRIRSKAKELYMARGQQRGRDWEDWFEAERIVLRDLERRQARRQA